MVALGVGCGKKGAPLPPLQRIPVAPIDFAVTRIENDVFARLTVPAVNVDGLGPADIARIEVYAITADRVPQVIDPEVLRSLATLVGSEPVRRPLPPPPPAKEGMPPFPVPPPGPGVDQGALLVVRETLSVDARTPVTLPPLEDERGVPVEIIDVPRALIAPIDGGGPQRYYFATAISPRGRYGPPTALVPVPLGEVSAAPSTPEITVAETSMTVRWKPPVDARGVNEAPEEGLLASRPTVPGAPPTTYDVYEVSLNQTPAMPTAVNATPAMPTPVNATPGMPTALTAAPIGGLEFVQDGITLGAERCFVVRAVDIINGIHVRGPASPMACAPFTDTFAPSPPGNLDVVAVSGAISLIWEGSISADVAGYLVLRGDGPSGTLAPLTKEIVPATAFRDEAVKAGARYIYAVVAVDRAGNRSEESNRREETARQ